MAETVESLRASNLQGTAFVGNLLRIQLSWNIQLAELPKTTY